MLRPYIPPRQPDATEREQLWSDGNFIGGMLILLVTLMSFTYTVAVLLLTMIGIVLPNHLSTDDLGLGNTRFLLLYSMVYTISMGLPTLCGLLLFRKNPRPLFAAQRVAPLTGFSAICIGLGGCMAANILANIITVFFQIFGITQPEAPNTLSTAPQSLLLNIYVFALLPALLEELLFRVCILQTLRRYGDRPAIVLSALLFGWMHGGASQSIFAFFVGLLIGWLVVATNNVWIGVAVHFANNALSVLLQYVGLFLPETLTPLFNILIIVGILLLGGIVLIICTLYRSPLITFPHRSQIAAGAVTGALCKTPLMIIAAILLFLRMISMMIG